MKQYREKIIITAVITFMPIVIGLLLWNKLPDTLATHWGADNQANGWQSKEFVVFGMPLIMTVLHLVAICATLADPKKKNISKKMYNIMFWIIPVTSWGVMVIIYVSGLGIDVNAGFFANILVGIIFTVIGNYIPKNNQNYTVGFRLPWTLNDEENWNKTNRLSGYVLMICGLAFIINAFILSVIPIIIVAIVGVCIPIIYSYALYRKKL